MEPEFLVFVPTCCDHSTDMDIIGLYCFQGLNGKMVQDYLYIGDAVDFSYLPCNSFCEVKLFPIIDQEHKNKITGELNDNSRNNFSN